MKPENHKIERILVRGTNWIGDAVMSAPALAALRACFPDAHITLLAPPRVAELFDGAPYFDEIIHYRRNEEGVSAFFQAVRLLRARRFDLAVLFQNAFEAALLAALGGARMRVGFNEQRRGALLTTDLYRGQRHRNRHQVYDYLDIVWVAERAYWLPILEQEMKRIKARMKKLDRMAAKRDPDQDAVYAEMDSIRAKMSEIEALTASLDHPSTRTKFLTQEHYPKLTASPRQQSAAGALLRARGIELQGKPLVALNAGATNSRAKCWPAERFAALADRLVEAFDAQIVLVGASPERETAQAVADGMLRRGAINLAGETTMTELVGLLDACHLLVSNDTGPAHIAAALGRPTLTIFGPTNEFETAPTGKFSELIRAEGIECARCMHRDCPIDHRCMTRISAERIFDRAQALLEETRS